MEHGQEGASKPYGSRHATSSSRDTPIASRLLDARQSEARLVMGASASGTALGHGIMGPGYGQGQMGPGMMGFSQGGLNQLFDEEQRSTARELMQENRPTQVERMNKMMEMREKMFSLMQQQRPDPDEVQTLNTRLAELQGEMISDQLREAMPYRR